MGSLRFLNLLTTFVILYIILREICCTKALVQDEFGLRGGGSQGPTQAQQLTIEISPGVEECFYQPMVENRTLTIDYAVTATSQGGHDINFQLLHPNGRPLITEFRKAASSPTVPTGNTIGVYRFCFDNTFSHMSRKTITFSIINAEVNPEPIDWEAYDKQMLKPEEQHSIAVQDIMKAIDNVRVKLNDIQVIQDNYRILEARDRSIGENNYERINFWSMMCIFTIVSFGLLQVFIVRSLFEDKYKSIRKKVDTFLGDKQY